MTDCLHVPRHVYFYICNKINTSALNIEKILSFIQIYVYKSYPFFYQNCHCSLILVRTVTAASVFTGKKAMSHKPILPLFIPPLPIRKVLLHQNDNE